MFKGIYSGRKVLVTGHTGFKGSWLTAWLLALGADVAGFSLSVPTKPANFEILGLAGRIKHYTGDIRDREAITAVVKEFAPEVVFHLAAQAIVRRSYAHPAETMETNIMGTVNLLEAVQSSPSVRSLVCITSDKCYRNDEWVWGYRETDHLGGYDPYSASKAGAEIVAHSYFRSGLPVDIYAATARAGNVIGGGDWAEDRIVPDCVRAWTNGNPVSIRSPWATRPWQHVLEPVSAYLWLGACLFSGHVKDGLPVNKEAFNFGPPSEVNKTVGELVDNLAPFWPGFSSEMDRSGTAGRAESTLLKLCCDKALAHLDWQAVLDFNSTIDFTASWYRAWHEGTEDMFAFTMRQIENYISVAKKEGLSWAAS